MKAHDLTTILTSFALLCACACDSAPSASGKSDEASAKKGDSKEAKAKDAEPEKPAGDPHHCDLIKGAGTCFQWSLAPDAVKPKEEFCTGSTGTFGKGGCPSEGDLGTCVLKGDKDIHYYDTHGHYQASPAQAECTALKKGDWTAS